MRAEDFDPLTPVVGWKLWYCLGSGAPCTSIDSSQISWDRAGSDGVQVLITCHPGGRRMIWTGRDSYLIPGGESKAGLEIDRDVFEAINLIARDDGWRCG